MSSIVGDAGSGAASVGRSVSVSNSDTVQKIGKCLLLSPLPRLLCRSNF